MGIESDQIEVGTSKILHVLGLKCQCFSLLCLLTMRIMLLSTNKNTTLEEGRLDLWNKSTPEMEGLQANITGTCPLAFQGVTGQMFASAVAAMVAAHCSMFDDYSWPKDNAKEILARGPVIFDFIIVGAGTAGSAIAGLLAEFNPSWTVLLVEAGDDPSLNSEVPAFLMFNHDIDWKYQTKADGKSCLSFNNNRCIWNRGKAMGGSSAINAMLYIRGHPQDYQSWKDSGNVGWGYEELIPHFKTIEKKFKFESYKYHDNPWYDILDKSYRELGLSNDEVDNNEGNIGAKVIKLATRNGKRLNSAKMYLKGRSNFYIMKNSLVQKVIVDRSTLTAKGIELKYKNSNVIGIQAKKEIILSAGSVATPHILMLSGIGPQDHLNEKGIECFVDLAVGQNLQDHILLPLLFKTNMQIEFTSEQIIIFLVQYMLQRTGPLSNIGLTDYMSFIDTQNNSRYPNIQFFHSYFTRNDHFMLRTYFEGFGYKKEIVDQIVKINKDNDLLGIYPTLLHPRSKGEIKLSDTSPDSDPEIVPNYFKDAHDIQTLLEGIRFTKMLENTETFKSLGVEIIEIDLPGCKDFLFNSNDYWECYIRNMGTTIYHPIGTAKMGPKDNPTSVVNHDLIVHGMRNLRVVDASIMPTIPGGNTMAPTLVIAEKAFDIIKKHYSVKDEL